MTISSINKKYLLIGVVIAGLLLLFLAPEIIIQFIPLLTLGGAALLFHLNKTQPWILNKVRKQHPHIRSNQTIVGARGSSGMLLDEDASSFVLFEAKCSGEYNYRDVICSEVIEDGSSVSSTVRSSQAIGAVVGGLAFGGIGAVVGALTGKTRSRNEVSRVSVAITVSDTQHPLYSVILLDEAKPVLRTSSKAQEAIAVANRLHSLLGVLIRKADNEDEKAKARQITTPAQQTPAILPKFDRASFTEEFMKLAKLKEQGHLSEHEFSELKAALILQKKENSASAG